MAAVNILDFLSLLFGAVCGENIIYLSQIYRGNRRPSRSYPSCVLLCIRAPEYFCKGSKGHETILGSNCINIIIVV
uniref:Putative secreted protein n=1 Tax=Ixodes ricinus TaxID=34613 RepID=A0A6B0U5G2_IXORI